MGYLAVKGSEEAIGAARLLSAPTGGRETAEAVQQHLPLAVDEIQAEAGLYEPRLAATAFTQARGDLGEAAFLLRGYRSTLPRRAPAHADTTDLRPHRRVSSAFRNIPGGQVLGATSDYGLRLLDLELGRRPDRPDQRAGEAGSGTGSEPSAPGGRGAPRATVDEATVDEATDDAATVGQAATGEGSGADATGGLPKVLEHLRKEGLVASSCADAPPAEDITRVALRFPASRSARLQALARGQAGAMTAFAYANLRGYGPFHPTLAELRVGTLPLTVAHPRTGRPVPIGEIEVTEAEALGQKPQQESRTLGVGYGCVLGRCERKAIAMAVLDAVLSGLNDDAPFDSPLADEEFVLAHIDGLEAAGFVEHMKLPHEVTFASDLDRVRSIQDRASSPEDHVHSGQDQVSSAQFTQHQQDGAR